jgi:hypothetical protein
MLDGMRTRLGTRRTLEAQWKQTRLPSLTSKSSKKDFKKTMTDMEEKRLDADHLEVEDMTRLLDAYLTVCDKHGENPNEFINAAWSKNPLSEEDQAILNQKHYEEQKEREKEAKKLDGRSPGQKKMIKDDGSICEEATAVTKEKLTAENDPAVEKASGKGKGGKKGQAVDPAPANSVSPTELVNGKKNQSPSGSSPGSTTDATPAGQPTQSASGKSEQSLPANAEKSMSGGPSSADTKKPALAAVDPGKPSTATVVGAAFAKANAASVEKSANPKPAPAQKEQTTVATKGAAGSSAADAKAGKGKGA